MRYLLMGLVLTASIFIAATAQAAQWQFCIASDLPRHETLITPLFVIELPRANVEQRLRAQLQQQGVDVSVVQCPQALANKGDAWDNRQKAIVMNETLHMTISQISAPAGSIASDLSR